MSSSRPESLGLIGVLLVEYSSIKHGSCLWLFWWLWGVHLSRRFCVSRFLLLFVLQNIKRKKGGGRYLGTRASLVTPMLHRTKATEISTTHFREIFFSNLVFVTMMKSIQERPPQ